MIRDEFDQLFGDVELPNDSELQQHTREAKISAATRQRWDKPENRKKYLTSFMKKAQQLAKKYKGKTTREWAEIHNCTQNKIQEHLRKFGNLDRINDFEIKTIDGKTYKEWADELGVSVTAICLFYQRNGHLNGCGNGLNLYQGKTTREWAEIHNCSIQKISRYLKKHGNLDNIGKKIVSNEKIVYEGKTYKQLEAEYGARSKTIRAHLKKYGNLDNLKKKQ